MDTFSSHVNREAYTFDWYTQVVLDQKFDFSQNLLFIQGKHKLLMSSISNFSV